MDVLKNIVSNSSEALLTAGVAGVASKFVYGDNVINTSLPVLSYLNGFDALWLYAIIFGTASAFQSNTGDFIAPYVPNALQFRSVNNLTRPMSIGLLSVGLIFLLNGFSISMSSALKAFVLGSASNVVGQWGTQQIFPKPLYVNSNGSLPQGIPNVGQQPVKPFEQFGFGDSMGMFGGFF